MQFIRNETQPLQLYCTQLTHPAAPRSQHLQRLVGLMICPAAWYLCLSPLPVCLCVWKTKVHLGFHSSGINWLQDDAVVTRQLRNWRHGSNTGESPAALTHVDFNLLHLCFTLASDLNTCGFIHLLFMSSFLVQPRREARRPDPDLPWELRALGHLHRRKWSCPFDSCKWVKCCIQRTDCNPQPVMLIWVLLLTVTYPCFSSVCICFLFLRTHTADDLGALGNLAMLFDSRGAQVRRQKIWEVVRFDSFEVNNLLDDKYQPRERQVIVREACSMVGDVMPYCIATHNCEHFVTGLRYGKPESRQVGVILTFPKHSQSQNTTFVPRT